jgi:allene oxide cyclase
MLRKLLMTAGVGALVAMAIGGASFASASDESGGRTIVVIEKATSEKFLDHGKHGPSPGDHFFFASLLWNAAQTHRVGSNHGYCVIETPPIAHCAGTVRLGGGTLEYAFRSA